MSEWFTVSISQGPVVYSSVYCNNVHLIKACVISEHGKLYVYTSKSNKYLDIV